ncbi:hypothetical protein L2E82_31433 [Cichorium intybus]|uniref:Uncharacterized protein n=1 Tax=Cichorium intybus TaxID=13427 RepID=A0ACB9D3I1_CICIN|nr:hypothetical protein L2E82_31433 [Cichorium intybus]
MLWMQIRKLRYAGNFTVPESCRQGRRRLGNYYKQFPYRMISVALVGFVRCNHSFSEDYPQAAKKSILESIPTTD